MERLTAGSTAAARKCLLITRKIIIPPPDSEDPPDGPPYFMKKTFPPDCGDPPASSSHARKCVRAKKRFAPLTAGTHSYIFVGKEVPDSRDPPGRSIRRVVILVANVYVHANHITTVTTGHVATGRPVVVEGIT